MATTIMRPSLETDELVDAPHISVLGIPKPFMVRHGDPAFIRVQVSGFPTPSIRWYVGHHQVFEDAQYQLVHEGTQSTLFVSWADDELGNGVKVLATNQGGEDKAYIDVKLYKVLNASRQRRQTRLTSTKSNQSLAFRRRRREEDDPGRMIKSFGSFGSISDLDGEEDKPWGRLNKSAEDIIDEPQKTNNNTFRAVNHNRSSGSGVTDEPKSPYRLPPKFSSTDDVVVDVRRPHVPPEQIVFQQDRYEENYRALPRSTQSLPMLRKTFSLPPSSAGEISGLPPQQSELGYPSSPVLTDTYAGIMDTEASERPVTRRTPRELKRSSKRDSNRGSKRSSQYSNIDSQTSLSSDVQMSLPQDPYQTPQRYSQGSTTSSKRTSNQSLPQQDYRSSAQMDPNAATHYVDPYIQQTSPYTGTQQAEPYTGSQHIDPHPTVSKRPYIGDQQMDQFPETQPMNISEDNQSNLWEMSGNRMSNLCQQYLGDYQFLEQQGDSYGRSEGQYNGGQKPGLQQQTQSQQQQFSKQLPQQQTQQQFKQQQTPPPEQQLRFLPAHTPTSSLPDDQTSFASDSQRSSVRKKKKKRVSPLKEVNGDVTPTSPSQPSATLQTSNYPGQTVKGNSILRIPPSPVVGTHNKDAFHTEGPPSLDTSTAHSFLDTSMRSVGSSVYDPSTGQSSNIPPLPPKIRDMQGDVKLKKRRKKKSTHEGDTGGGALYRTSSGTYLETDLDSHFLKGDPPHEATNPIAQTPQSVLDTDYPKAQVVYVDIYGNPLNPQPSLENSVTHDSSFAADPHSQSFSEGVFIPNGDVKVPTDNVTVGSVVIETREVLLPDGKLKKKKVRKVRKQPLVPNIGIETNIDDVMNDNQPMDTPLAYTAEPHHYQRLPSHEVTPSDPTVVVEPAVTEMIISDIPGSPQSTDFSNVPVMSDSVVMGKVKKVKKKRRQISSVDPPAEEAVFPPAPSKVEEDLIETAIVSNDPMEMRTPRMDRHVPIRRDSSRTYEQLSSDMDTSRQSFYSDMSLPESGYQPISKVKKLIKVKQSQNAEQSNHVTPQSFPPIEQTTVVPPELPMKLRDLPMQIEEYDDIPSFARSRERDIEIRPVNVAPQEIDAPPELNALDREIPFIESNDVDIHKVRKIRKGRKRPKIAPNLYDPVISSPDDSQTNQYPADMPLESPPPVPESAVPDLPLKVRDMPPPPSFMLTSESSQTETSHVHETEAVEMQTTIETSVEFLGKTETTSISKNTEIQGATKIKPPRPKPPVPAKPTSPVPKEVPVSPQVSDTEDTPVMTQVPMSSLVETKPFVPAFNTKPITMPPAYRPLFNPHESKTKPIITSILSSSSKSHTSTSSSVTTSSASSWSRPSPLKPFSPPTTSKPPILSPKPTSPPISPKPTSPPITMKPTPPTTTTTYKKWTSPIVSPSPKSLPASRKYTSPPMSPKPALPPKPTSPLTSPPISPRPKSENMPIGRPPKSPAKTLNKPKEKESEKSKDDFGNGWKGGLSRTMPFSDLHRSQDNLVISELSTTDMSYNIVGDSSDDDLQFKKRLRTKSYDNLALVEHQSRQREREMMTSHERSRSTGCLIEGRLCKLGRRTLTQEMLITKITTKEEITIVKPKVGGGTPIKKPTESDAERRLTKAIKETLPPHQGERKMIDGVLIVDIYDDSQKNIDTEVHVLEDKMMEQSEPTKQSVVTSEPLPEIVITPENAQTDIKPDSPTIITPEPKEELPISAIEIDTDSQTNEFDVSADSDAPNTSEESMDIPLAPEGRAPVAGPDELGSSMEQEEGEDDEEEEEEEEEEVEDSDDDDDDEDSSSGPNYDPDFTSEDESADDANVDSENNNGDKGNTVHITVELLDEEEYDDGVLEVVMEHPDEDDEEPFVPDDMDVMVHRNSIVLDDDESLDDLLESLEDNLQQVGTDIQDIEDSLRTKQFQEPEPEQFDLEPQLENDLVQFPAPSACVPDEYDDGVQRVRIINVVENVFLETIPMDEYRKSKKPSVDIQHLPEVDPNSIDVYECGEMLYLYNHMPETIGVEDLARARRETLLMDVEEELCKNVISGENKHRRQEILLERSLSEIAANPDDDAMQKVFEHIKRSLSSSDENCTSLVVHGDDEECCAVKISEDVVTEKFSVFEPEQVTKMVEGDGSLSNSIIHCEAVFDNTHEGRNGGEGSHGTRVDSFSHGVGPGGESPREKKSNASQREMFPKGDEPTSRPRRGSCGSTGSTASTGTQSSQDTVILVSQEPSVDDPPHSQHHNDEEDFPRDGEGFEEKSYEIPVDPGMETFFGNENVVVKVVTKDDGQIKKINILEKGLEDEEDGDESSDDGSNKTDSEEMGHSSDAYDDDCIDEVLEAVQEVSEPEQLFEEDASIHDHVQAEQTTYVQAQNSVDVRQTMTNSASTVASPGQDVICRSDGAEHYSVSAATNQRLDDIDTDVVVQKAFVESVISSVGTIIFLLIAALIFHLVDYFMKDDF